MHVPAPAAFTTVAARQEPAAFSPSLARLVGESPAMTEIRAKLARIARASGSVLVQGASGTGKELAARVIHELSHRAGGPFVAVDCGALSESVLESELFGHARGAFTGAAGDRRGLFEAAHGGTIFLDEISNTSLGLQARLLRVLQEREVRRVGCNVPRRVDVRVIAASNQDLGAAVGRGAFREDLLYRLDVLSVRMPRLAERRDDVAPIAEAVLLDVAQAEGRRVRLSVEALALLQAHDWPGNVRELRNALERAAAFAEDGVIRPANLPERLSCAPARVAVGALDSRAGGSAESSLQALLDDFERRLLLLRLQSNGWNRTRTALELGITRRTLFTKMQKLGISGRD